MIINQLFKEKPPIELIYRYCHLFGLSGIYDKKWFTKKDLINNQTVQKIHDNILDDLKGFYIRCKARSYLTDIDETLAITILRQLLKTNGFKVITRNIAIDGFRRTEYCLNKI